MWRFHGGNVHIFVFQTMILQSAVSGNQNFRGITIQNTKMILKNVSVGRAGRNLF